MALLGVNVDHVANIRESRKGNEPDPVTAALIAELAGAHGITVHLREDRRHIQERDIRLLRELVKTKLNVEMALTEEMVKIALSVKPDMVTFVPEKKGEVTTEGGLDVVSIKDHLKDIVKLLQEAEIAVSLFIDSNLEQVKAAHKAGSDYIEIHTGSYAKTKSIQEEDIEYEKILNAVKLGSKLEMGINAGHDLTYRNVGRIASIKEVVELNIGHNIIARAVFVGMEQAVKEMLLSIEGK
ncbi:MAG: pyridoxine 5'-phosphate synthase [bacterium]